MAKKETSWLINAIKHSGVTTIISRRKKSLQKQQKFSDFYIIKPVFTFMVLSNKLLDKQRNATKIKNIYIGLALHWAYLNYDIFPSSVMLCYESIKNGFSLDFNDWKNNFQLKHSSNSETHSNIQASLNIFIILKSHVQYLYICIM